MKVKNWRPPKLRARNNNVKNAGMAKKKLREDKIKKSLRATSVELQSRDISVETDNKIYSRDFDNNYPERIERVIANSPTGRRCANLMAKYIAGEGVEDTVIVNRKGETLNDIIDASSNDIAYQYGVYFHTTWKLNENGSGFDPGSLRVLDYVSMAKSQEDGNDYPGKFYYLKKKDQTKIWNPVETETTWYYPYNDNPKIILEQMKNDCKLKGLSNPSWVELLTNYRGQVYYLNLTPKFVYALPLGDSVYNDMDTEFHISQYQNQQTRNGWLGKTVIVKFDDDEEDDADNFDDVIKDNLGSENAADPLIVSVPFSATDDLKKAFLIEQLKPQYDDKLFETTVKNIRQNILGAFNNIPEPLIFSGTGALFGTSADTYTEMKRFYWEQNEYERFKLESTLSKLLKIEVNFLPIKGVENANINVH